MLKQLAAPPPAKAGEGQPPSEKRRASEMGAAVDTGKTAEDKVAELEKVITNLQNQLKVKEGMTTASSSKATGGMLATLAEKPERKSKPRRHVEDAEDIDHSVDSYKQLIIHVSKLALAEAYSGRVLRAVCLDVTLVPRTLAVVDASKQATRNFATNMQGASAEKRSSAPPPHTLVWDQYITFMEVEGAKVDTEESREMREALSGYKEELKPFLKDANTLAMKIVEHVRHIRFAKCFKKETVRLEVGIGDGSPALAFWKSSRKFLTKQLGGEAKHGIAPRTNLERKVQDELDKMVGKREQEDW
jgi:hypothetical protein